jgi:hypothetical protein
MKDPGREVQLLSDTDVMANTQSNNDAEGMKFSAA